MSAYDQVISRVLASPAALAAAALVVVVAIWAVLKLIQVVLKASGVRWIGFWTSQGICCGRWRDAAPYERINGVLVAGLIVIGLLLLLLGLTPSVHGLILRDTHRARPSFRDVSEFTFLGRSRGITPAHKTYSARLDLTSGLVFPSKRSPTGHIPAGMLNQWLKAAEVAAKLPKLRGGPWHPYRWKWASERMHLSLKAVADAGGRKDVATLMRCYQDTDDELLRSVMANDGARRGADPAGGAA